MSKPAFTVKAFGIYAIILGLALITVPNLLLGLFGLPSTSEVWIRVVGVVVVNIGVGYWCAARSESRIFFRGTLYTRWFVLIAFVGFWLLGYVSPVLILFGILDAAGALWTQRALSAEEG
jgi:hypothetical protein